MQVKQKTLVHAMVINVVIKHCRQLRKYYFIDVIIIFSNMSVNVIFKVDRVLYQPWLYSYGFMVL